MSEGAIRAGEVASQLEGGGEARVCARIVRVQGNERLEAPKGDVRLAPVEIKKLIPMQRQQMPFHPRLDSLVHLSPSIRPKAESRLGLIINVQHLAKLFRLIQIGLRMQIQTRPLDGFE